MSIASWLTRGLLPILLIGLATAALQALVFAIRPGALAFFPVLAVAYALSLAGSRRVALYVACASAATLVAVAAAAVFGDPERPRAYVGLVAALVFGLISTAMSLAAFAAGMLTLSIRERRRHR